MYVKTHPYEYRSWLAMKARCNNPKSTDYRHYGARGVKVCERWNHSFHNFLSDMGYKPSRDHTLDRIDVNGNYEPENCRWATRKEQALNRRVYKSNQSGHSGVTFRKDIGKWVARIKVSGRNIWLGSFDSQNDAIKKREIAEYELQK